MSQKTVVFVESSCVGAGYLAAAAIELGYSPLFLTSPSFSQGDTRANIVKHRFIECDTSSVEAMQAALTREIDLREVEFVTSFADTCLGLASNLARRLSVRGLGEVVDALKDKGAVYNWVPEYSPPSVVFSARDIPEGAIRELLAHGPIMVKGRRSSGGLGAFVLRSPDEVGKLGQLMASSTIPGHLAPDLWIAQAFVDGKLVSLEGYVSGGRPEFLGFSGRKKVGMSESIIMFPWEEGLTQAAMDRAKEAITTLVKRSGFDNGYFHVEFMCKDDKAYIIDANMGRIGGGGLGQQFALAFGTTPEAVHRHALELELTGKPLSTKSPYKGAPRPTSSVMYGVPVQATIQDVKLPETFESFHTRILDHHQVVPPMGQDNYAWIGITSGLRGKVESETSKIEIQTDKGRFSATF
ncbi:MAG: acetyl-CoA carboxylase biotin carboxylase subunit family protein [Hyalangium sp.]|uniref:ATP-grasp domain-containing protein n=1 Tax=Hyalangium sp. TaxID=2028555 RepID=UPI003899D8B3